MNQENLFTKDSIRTYSGKYLNLKDPHPKQIDIIDIAIGLSRVPRFAAQTQKALPVAQHCLAMSNMAPVEYKLAALMHDASEAYIGDVPRPLKQLLPEYKTVECKLMNVIAVKFGFQYPLPDIVKELDDYMLHREWELKMLRNDYDSVKECDCYSRFMQRFDELVQLQPINKGGGK